MTFNLLLIELIRVRRAHPLGVVEAFFVERMRRERSRSDLRKSIFAA
jgi:hypothetical protein